GNMPLDRPPFRRCHGVHPTSAQPQMRLRTDTRRCDACRPDALGHVGRPYLFPPADGAPCRKSTTPEGTGPVRAGPIHELVSSTPGRSSAFFTARTTPGTGPGGGDQRPRLVITEYVGGCGHEPGID